MHNPSSHREAFVGSHLRQGGFDLHLQSYKPFTSYYKFSSKQPAPPTKYVRYCALDVQYIGQTSSLSSRLSQHVRALIRSLHRIGKSLPTYKRALNTFLIAPACLLVYAETQKLCKLLDEAHDIKMTSPKRNSDTSLRSVFGFQQVRRGARHHRRLKPAIHVHTRRPEANRRQAVSTASITSVSTIRTLWRLR